MTLWLELSKKSLLTLFSLFVLFKISENGFLVVNSTVFRSFEPPRFMRVVAVELIEDVALDDFMWFPLLIWLAPLPKFASPSRVWVFWLFMNVSLYLVLTPFSVTSLLPSVKPKFEMKYCFICIFRLCSEIWGLHFFGWAVNILTRYSHWSCKPRKAGETLTFCKNHFPIIDVLYEGLQITIWNVF